MSQNSQLPIEESMDTIRCVGCNADIPKVVNFCPICGAAAKQAPQEVETTYVAIKRKTKSKERAMVLNVLLSSSGFIYTLEKDYFRFMIGTAINAGGFVFVVKTGEVFFPFWILTWLHAVLIVARRERSFYVGYYEND